MPRVMTEICCCMPRSFPMTTSASVGSEDGLRPQSIAFADRLGKTHWTASFQFALMIKRIQMRV